MLRTCRFASHRRHALGAMMGAPVYRSDVDGLRALAVTLVVAYHAKAPILVGGFLGVDIFFVISGYVISRLLLRELQDSGSIAFMHFWRRRVIRLAPALLLVLSAVLIAAPLVLQRMSGEIGPLARATLATLGLNANHFFLLESTDYFAAAAETNPLLHMWSLSVEEQFYLLSPALLLLGWRRLPRRMLVLAVVVAMASSFASALWLAQTQPAAAFYLLPPRAWQLLTGALVALLGQDSAVGQPLQSRSSGRWLPGLGLAMILGASVTPADVVPGLLPALAAVAVVGTALIIRYGDPSQSHGVSRWLAYRAVVYVGRISFPVYLWHWPLLVMTRSARLYEAAPTWDVICVVASVGLGALTYELLEKRVQRGARGVSSRRVFFSATVLTFSLAGCAVLLGAWVRFGWGYTPLERRLDASRRDVAQVGCIFRDGYPPPEWEAACFPKEDRDSILLWGDSHAQHWAPAISALAAQEGVTLASFSLGGCQPLPRRSGNARCDRFYRDVEVHLDGWKAERRLRGVVLSARWADGTGAVPLSVANQAEVRRTGFAESGVKNETEALALFELFLRRQLERLRLLDLRVLLVLPSPSQPFSAAHCLVMRAADQCFATVSGNERYSGAVKHVMRRLAAEFDNVRLFDPNDLLCDANRCPEIIDGVVVYSDDNHLTQSFVKRAAPGLRTAVAWLVHGEGR